VTAIRSDGADLVITASADGTARAWDLNGPGRQLHALRHAAPVAAAAALSPEVAVTATAAAAHLWRRGARARSFPLQAPVSGRGLSSGRRSGRARRRPAFFGTTAAG
jgi:hypothetical protein